MARIGIITHTPRVIDLAREISAETGHELITKLGIPNQNAIEKAYRLQREEDVDAIIAPGAIYEVLCNRQEFPVVRLEFTNFELLKAIHQAFKFGKRIVYVDFKRDVTRVYDPELVKNIFDDEIDRLTMHDTGDVEAIVETILQNKYDAVISAAHCILDRTSPISHPLSSPIAKSTCWMPLFRRFTSLKRATGKRKTPLDANDRRILPRRHADMQ
jgi:hypothetical protein